MPTAEELELSRAIRRDFAKRPINSDRLEISIIRGRVYLGGTIMPNKTEFGIRVKEEVLGVIERITKYTGVKQVINECRMKEEELKESSHGHDQSQGKLNDKNMT